MQPAIKSGVDVRVSNIMGVFSSSFFRDLLCGGKRDFAFTIGGSGVPMWSETAHDHGIELPYPSQSSLQERGQDWNERLSFQNRFVESLIMQDSSNFLEKSFRSDQLKMPNLDSGQFSLNHMESETSVEATSNWNPKCLDIMSMRCVP